MAQTSVAVGDKLQIERGLIGITSDDTSERAKSESKGMVEESQILERRYYYPPFYENLEIDPGLFKLVKDGRVLYVLGTAHRFPMAILPEAYLKTIRSCKQAYFESTVRTTLTEAELLQIGLIKEHPQSDWNKGFTPVAEEIFKNAFQILHKNSGKTVQIERANPKMAFWFCHRVASIHTMDEELETLFGENVESLDTVDSITPVFTEFSIDETNEKLESVFGYLRNSPHYNAAHLEYDKDYLSGKFLYDREFIREEEEDQTMVVNRNKVWFPKLNQANFKEPTFVGVGFAHLVGRSGLLSLMENAGWKVFKMTRAGKEEPISVAKLFAPSLLTSTAQQPILNGFRNFVREHRVKLGLGTLGLISAVALGRAYFKKK